MKAEIEFGFNPLFIGACWATPAERMAAEPESKFQSPLHRGMLGDLLDDARNAPEASGFNPLFIGACWATKPMMVCEASGYCL